MGMNVKQWLAAALGLTLATQGIVHAQEKLPSGSRIVSLEAHPATVTLKTPFEYAQVLLLGQLDSGDRVDVTRLAKLESSGEIMSVSATGLVRPVSDGTGTLHCTIGGQSIDVPVAVNGLKNKVEVSFVR